MSVPSANNIFIKHYYKSNNELENKYFYDPLEKYFGKNLNLTGKNTDEIYIIENKFKLNPNCDFLVRTYWKQSKTNLVLEFDNTMKQRKDYIDIPFKNSIERMELSFRYKIKNRWYIKPLFIKRITSLYGDFIPRDIDPKKEITGLGDITLTSSGNDYGVSGLFKADDKCEIFFSGIYSEVKNNLNFYFSTPVLGMVEFLPIVHRIRGQFNLSLPSKHLQIGITNKSIKNISLDLILNYQIIDVKGQLIGETHPFTGLIKHSYDEKIYFEKAIQTMYANSKVEYCFLRNLKLNYQITLLVPFISQELQKHFYIEEAPKSVEIVQPVKRETSGGVTHQISLCYVF